MDQKFWTVAIVLALIFFVLGGALGMWYQVQRDSVLAGKAGVMDTLSSKLVISMVVYGEVSKIDGRNVTLTFGGQKMTLNVGNNAKIYSFISSTPTPGATQQTVPFDQIKVGSKLNAAVAFTPDGSLSVQSVIILH